jgi:hypothetical protein
MSQLITNATAKECYRNSLVQIFKPLSSFTINESIYTALGNVYATRLNEGKKIPPYGKGPQTDTLVLEP